MSSNAWFSPAIAHTNEYAAVPTPEAALGAPVVRVGRHRVVLSPTLNVRGSTAPPRGT